MTSTHTPRNRREADTLARLLELLADGVDFNTAVWTATDRGREMDTARLVDLFNGHRRASAAPATPATPGPWRYVWPCVIANVDGDSVEVALCRAAAVGSVEVADANGRLIAAAPELLRLARLALEELEGLSMHTPRALRDDLRRVITDATSASTSNTTDHKGA